MRKLLFLIAAFTLSGCADNFGGEGSLLPMPYENVQDPDDALLADAVQKFLSETAAPIASQYEFTRYDLNGDDRREALVLFKNPYGYWCDMHGCAMLVFEAHDDGFELLNAIQPVRGPLFISGNRTNGWRDLIIHVSGRWDETKDVTMEFDGTQYPANPDAQPAHENVSVLGAARIFP